MSAVSVSELHTRLSIVPDCYYIASRLREHDKKDVKAAGLEPHRALLDGYIYSSDLRTICLPDGTPAAMFGVAPIKADGLNIGSIWLLGTDELVKYRWKFLRESRYWLRHMSVGFDLLCNCVHRDNTEHIRWIRWLGFSFLRHTESHGEPIIEFAKITSNV
jgi:hypothetical protein